MAFQPRGYTRKLSPELRSILVPANVNNRGELLSSTKEMAYYKKHNIKPMMTKSELEETVKASEKHGVSIEISAEKIKKHEKYGASPTCDGIAVETYDKKNKESEYNVYLHPVVQWKPKSYVKDIIRHEYDHIKVFKKRRGIQKPQSYKAVAVRM